MDFSKVAQVVGKSIGIAIGLCFSIYYSATALLSLSRNNSQIIAVSCIAVVIAIIVLIKSKNRVVE